MKVDIVYCRDVQEIKQQTKGAAAFDLYAAEAFKIVKKGFNYAIPTGIMCAIPSGVCALILERSSTFNRGLSLCNKVGLVDSDYRGELLLNMLALEDGEIKIGDRIAQLLFLSVVPVEFNVVNKLKGTKRGAGGFGSTGG